MNQQYLEMARILSPRDRAMLLSQAGNEQDQTVETQQYNNAMRQASNEEPSIFQSQGQEPPKQNYGEIAKKLVEPPQQSRGAMPTIDINQLTPVQKMNGTYNGNDDETRILMSDNTPAALKDLILSKYKPKEAKTHTLSSGQKVFGADGKMIAQNEGEDEINTRLGHLQAQGIDPKSPQGQGYLFNGEMKMGGGQSKLEEDMQARARIADQQGLPKGSPEYKSFVVHGEKHKSESDGVKFTETDKKEIVEADSTIQAHRNTLGNLSRAKTLNEQAYSGFGAETRGNVAAQLGIGGGRETQELISNLNATALDIAQRMKGALSDNDILFVKSIGGMPMQDPKVRANIIDRLTQITQKGHEFETMKASQLRGRTYFKDGGGGAGDAQQKVQPQSPLDAARDAISRGAPRDAVIQRLKQNGIDTNGL